MPAMLVRAYVRRIATWVVGTLIVATLILGPISGAVGQFFINLFTEWGWYDHPTRTWVRFVSALHAFIYSPWTLGLVAALTGIVAGMWIDTWLHRRERQPFIEAAERRIIDREALSTRAEMLGKAIAELAGRGAARQAIAWQQYIHDRDRTDNSARERAAMIESYGEKYHADAWQIIDAASRLIDIDKGDIWQVQNIMSSGYEIESMSRYLMVIANALRYPDNPARPFVDRRLASHQAALNSSQQPQDTGPGTPP